ncbi:MAG: hypothetical protein IKV44_03140 [Clostridia bacterium]|nr:hypothetical protein [Clostridia bacterium]
MTINEQFIMGKKTEQALCEDGLFISDSFIAVLDGVTPKSDRSFNGLSGGKAAMEAALKALADVPADITGSKLFEAINKAIAELYNGEPTGEAAVCMIVYSAAHKEIWSLGDCQCIIGNVLHTHEKLIDIELSEERAEIIKDALKKGYTIDQLTENDIGRQAIMPKLQEQHLFANRTDHKYGYAVLNGGTFNTDSIVAYPVNEGDSVVLATDGYPKLYASLKESEAYLKHLLTADPLCFNENKSTKGLQKGNLSFDDRAYIKFSV